MPNTALNRTTQVLLTNKSGGALVYGDVVVLDNTNTNGFTTTTTAGLSTRGLGVILEPSGIANNASGMVAVGGWCPKVNLNTAAAVGQFIKTHTVAGQGTPHASPQVEGDFAVALSASATPPCNLFGSPNGPLAGGAGTVTNTGTLTSGKVIEGNGTVDVTVSSLTATVVKAASGTLSAATVGTDYVAPIAVHGNVVNGRLTTETAVPISTADRTAQGTIYFTPYNGNQIALYTSSVWVVLTFSEISLALSGLTSGKNYDVFVDYNAGTPQIVLSAAWTNDTTRADAIALQDGVYVKSGTTTYRWVGTIRTTGTTTTEDSAAKRFVWNAYNRTPRSMVQVAETANTWNWTTASWQQANANTANQLMYVVGALTDVVMATVVGGAYTPAAQSVAVGIGVNSVTVNSARGTGFAPSATFINSTVTYSGFGSLGYNYLAWLEYGATSALFAGDNGSPAFWQYGISGTVFN